MKNIEIQKTLRNITLYLENIQNSPEDQHTIQNSINNIAENLTETLSSLVTEGYQSFINPLLEKAIERGLQYTLTQVLGNDIVKNTLNVFGVNAYELRKQIENLQQMQERQQQFAQQQGLPPQPVFAPQQPFPPQQQEFHQTMPPIERPQFPSQFQSPTPQEQRHSVFSDGPPAYQMQLAQQQGLPPQSVFAPQQQKFHQTMPPRPQFPSQFQSPTPQEQRHSVFYDGPPPAYQMQLAQQQGLPPQQPGFPPVQLPRITDKEIDNVIAKIQTRGADHFIYHDYIYGKDKNHFVYKFLKKGKQKIESLKNERYPNFTKNIMEKFLNTIVNHPSVEDPELAHAIDCYVVQPKYDRLAENLMQEASTGRGTADNLINVINHSELGYNIDKSRLVVKLIARDFNLDNKQNVYNIIKSLNDNKYFETGLAPKVQREVNNILNTYQTTTVQQRERHILSDEGKLNQVLSDEGKLNQALNRANIIINLLEDDIKRRVNQNMIQDFAHEIRELSPQAKRQFFDQLQHSNQLELLEQKIEQGGGEINSFQEMRKAFTIPQEALQQMPPLHPVQGMQQQFNQPLVQPTAIPYPIPAYRYGLNLEEEKQSPLNQTLKNQTSQHTKSALQGYTTSPHQQTPLFPPAQGMHQPVQPGEVTPQPIQTETPLRSEPQPTPTYQHGQNFEEEKKQSPLNQALKNQTFQQVKSSLQKYTTPPKQHHGERQLSKAKTMELQRGGKNTSQFFKR